MLLNGILILPPHLTGPILYVPNPEMRRLAAAFKDNGDENVRSHGWGFPQAILTGLFPGLVCLEWMGRSVLLGSALRSSLEVLQPYPGILLL